GALPHSHKSNSRCFSWSCTRSARLPFSAKRGSNCEVRGSPVLGRAQGWRCAPPPSAASALTPSAHRAFWHPCGRRDAPPGGRAKAGSCGSLRRAPGLVASEHRVQDDDQLAHACDQSDLGFLAPGAQALVVGLEHRVVLGGGAHDRHIEKVAELAASALDAPHAFALATV